MQVLWLNAESKNLLGDLMLEQALQVQILMQILIIYFNTKFLTKNIYFNRKNKINYSHYIDLIKLFI
jgi:hypothetical protein